MPWQHRGYFRALQEALLDKKIETHEQAAAAAAAAGADGGGDPLPTTRAKIPPCVAGITHQMDAQHVKQTEKRNGNWRPDILIVENEEFHEVGHILKHEGGEQQQQGGAEKPRLREVLAVYTHGEGDDEQRHVFVFPASKVRLGCHAFVFLLDCINSYNTRRGMTKGLQVSTGGLCRRERNHQQGRHQEGETFLEI